VGLVRFCIGNRLMSLVRYGRCSVGSWRVRMFIAGLLRALRCVEAGQWV